MWLVHGHLDRVDARKRTEDGVSDRASRAFQQIVLLVAKGAERGVDDAGIGHGIFEPVGPRGFGKVGRKLENAKDVGVYKRIEVSVAPLAKGEPVKAVTYQGTNSDRYQIPPTKHYMDTLIEGAYTFGLSMMWIAYLQSFSTQTGRKPRPPGHGDVAPRL